MESPKASKLMIRMVIVAAVVMIFGGSVFYRSLAAIPFMFGVLITSGLNVIKLRMLEKTVFKVVHMDDQESGKNVVRFQYLLRYFMTGAVLVLIGIIHNYTSAPPDYSSRAYLAFWAAIFPNAPEALLNAPAISIWGALFGLFTLQLSVFFVRSMKLEKDGTEFIEYVDDEEIVENVENNDEGKSPDFRDEMRENEDETQ